MRVLNNTSVYRVMVGPGVLWPCGEGGGGEGRGGGEGESTSTKMPSR